MQNEEDEEFGSLAQALRGTGAPDAARWARVRRELALRAAAEGLVDVAVERHDSPLGALVLGATAAGLVRVGLPAEDEDLVLDELAERISARVMVCGRASLTQARRELDEYFAGRRRSFEVPLDWRLSAGFAREVLRATADIPFGRTATYGEVARKTGRPAAYRAAGSALAANPLPILVPCHRVLPARGGVGDYRGGGDAKALLLALERAL